jgi:hypothetical protein
MKIVVHLSALVLLAVLATWAYRVNYATQEALDRVAELRVEVAAEREAIAVLRAEWAYLNRPDRLQALVTRHAETLRLVPLAPEHFASPSMVAYPPEPPLLADAPVPQETTP